MRELMEGLRSEADPPVSQPTVLLRPWSQCAFGVDCDGSRTGSNRPVCRKVVTAAEEQGQAYYPV